MPTGDQQYLALCVYRNHVGVYKALLERARGVAGFWYISYALAIGQVDDDDVLESIRARIYIDLGDPATGKFHFFTVYFAGHGINGLVGPVIPAVGSKVMHAQAKPLGHTTDLVGKRAADIDRVGNAVVCTVA